MLATAIKPAMPATINAKQTEAIKKILAKLNGQAYLIIFDLLDDEECTAYYQVRYNDRSGLALDFKQWAMVETDDNGTMNNSITTSVRGFVKDMLDELMYTMSEDTVIVKRMTIFADGSTMDD